MGLWRSPWRVKLWLAALLAVNMVAPLAFLHTMEAQVVLVALAASAALMVVLTALSGFSRLLGLGHVLWFPLVAWLWTRLDGIPPDDAFGLWVRALIVLNSISLAIDVADVARYALGDRAETVDGLSR